MGERISDQDMGKQREAELGKKQPDAEFETHFEIIRRIILEHVGTDIEAQEEMIASPEPYSSIVRFFESVDSEKLLSELSTCARYAIKDQLRSLVSIVKEERGIEMRLEDVWEAGNLVDIRIYYFEEPDKGEYQLPTDVPVNVVDTREDRPTADQEIKIESEYVTAEEETARKRGNAEYETLEPFTFTGKCHEESHQYQVTDIYRGPKLKIRGKGVKWYVDLDYGEVSCTVPDCVNTEKAPEGFRNIYFGKPRRVLLFYRHEGTSKAELEAWVKGNIRKIQK